MPANLEPTNSWQSVLLTSNMGFQCRAGTVLVTSGASQPTDDNQGVLLTVGLAWVYPSGTRVWYRAIKRDSLLAQDIVL